jgi:hypothetical protein
VLVLLSCEVRAEQEVKNSCQPHEPTVCDVILGLDRPLADRCDLFNHCLNSPATWQTQNRTKVLEWTFDDPAWLSMLDPAQLQQGAPAADHAAPIDVGAGFKENKESSLSCALLNKYLNQWNGAEVRDALTKPLVVNGKCPALTKIGQRANSHYFVLFSVAPKQSAYLLSRTAWGEVDFAPVKTFGDQSLFGDPITSSFAGELGIVAIPNGTQAYLLVQNQPDAQNAAPMLAWSVRPSSPAETGDQVLDLSGAGVLRTSLRLTIQEGDRLYLNGLDLTDKISGLTPVSLRRGPGMNRIVVTRTDSRNRRFRSVLTPLVDPPAFYEHRFTQAETRVAMLPVATHGCQGHGLNGTTIKNRVSAFLETYGKRVSDLGPLVGPARRLLEEFTAAGTRAASPGTASHDSNDAADLFVAAITEFRGRSFSELLDVRVDCSKTVSDIDVVTVTVVRADLLTMEQTAAEPELFRAENYFSSRSHMISGSESVRDGVVVPVARLYDFPTVAFSFAPESRAVQDDIYVEFQSNDLDDAQLSIRPISRLRCGNLNRLNALRGEWPRGTEGKRQNPTYVDAREDAGGASLSVQSDGAYELQLAPSDDAPHEATSIRCVEVKADGFELEGTYYFLHPKNPLFDNPRQQRLDGSWNPEVRDEKVVHRYFLFHIGPRDILTPAFGLWLTQRSGRYPSSWDDALASPPANEDGSIPYLVDRTAVMVGASLNGRSRLYRNATLDLRLYGLPRVEFLSLDRVPDELKAFRGAGNDDHEVTFDVTLATTLLLRWELDRHLNFNAGVGVAIPKVFHAINTGLVDQRHRTQADYEPTFPVASLGLGGGYTWR